MLLAPQKKSLLHKYKRGVNEANGILQSGLPGAARSQQMMSLGAGYRWTTLLHTTVSNWQAPRVFFIRKRVWSIKPRSSKHVYESTDFRNERLMGEIGCWRPHLTKLVDTCLEIFIQSMSNQCAFIYDPMASFIWQLPVWQFEGCQTNLAYEVLPLLSSTKVFHKHDRMHVYLLAWVVIMVTA